jgi:hypothetical protein
MGRIEERWEGKDRHLSSGCRFYTPGLARVVFVPFAVLYPRETPRLDFLWAGLCMVGAVYFMFRSAA